MGKRNRKSLKRRERKALIITIIALICGLVCLLWSFCSFRAFVYVGFFIISALAISILVFCFSKSLRKKVNHIMALVALILWADVYLCIKTEVYCHMLSIAPFLILSVCVGIALGLLALWKLWRPFTVKERIGTFLLVGFFGGAVAFSLSVHANYAFDFDTPLEYVAVIEDKEFDLNRRAPTSHYLTVTVEGQTYDVMVPRDDYYAYDIGDTYRVYRYAGAFGEPFYIAEGFH